MPSDSPKRGIGYTHSSLAPYFAQKTCACIGTAKRNVGGWEATSFTRCFREFPRLEVVYAETIVWKGGLECFLDVFLILDLPVPMLQPKIRSTCRLGLDFVAGDASGTCGFSATAATQTRLRALRTSHRYRTQTRSPLPQQPITSQSDRDDI
jgi:hypothetical protein